MIKTTMKNLIWAVLSLSISAWWPALADDSKPLELPSNCWAIALTNKTVINCLEWTSLPTDLSFFKKWNYEYSIVGEIARAYLPNDETILPWFQTKIDTNNDGNPDTNIWINNDWQAYLLTKWLYWMLDESYESIRYVFDLGWWTKKQLRIYLDKHTDGDECTNVRGQISLLLDWKLMREWQETASYCPGDLYNET